MSCSNNPCHVLRKGNYNFLQRWKSETAHNGKLQRSKNAFKVVVIKTNLKNGKVRYKLRIVMLQKKKMRNLQDSQNYRSKEDNLVSENFSLLKLFNQQYINRKGESRDYGDTKIFLLTGFSTKESQYFTDTGGMVCPKTYSHTVKYCKIQDI